MDRDGKGNQIDPELEETESIPEDESAAGQGAGDQFDVQIGDVGEGAQVAVGEDIKQTWIDSLVLNVFQRTNLKPVILLLVLVLAGIGAILFLLLPDEFGRGRMEGTFNIAVAAFDSLEDGNSLASDNGERVGAWLADRLAGEQPALPGGTVVDIWGPDKAGRVSGVSADERALAASALAEKIGANIVIYGYLEDDGGTVEVNPEFHVATTGFELAEEVTGHHELGASIAVPRNAFENPVISANVNEQLNARATALSQLTIGLIHFVLKDYQAAADAFSQAEMTPAWSEKQGKEVIYLFLGNSALNLGQYDEAHTWFERALAVDEGYARAYVGRGFASFQEAIAPLPDGDADRARLDESITFFQAGLSAPNQPARADVGSKAHFGLGRAYLVKSWQGYEDHWSEAEAELQLVIDDHLAGNLQLQELAAQSYGQLGLLNYISGDGQQALSAFEQARSLGEDPTFRAEWAGWLSRIHSETSNEAEATRYAEEAMQ